MVNEELVGKFMEWAISNGFSKHVDDPTPTI